MNKISNLLVIAIVVVLASCQGKSKKQKSLVSEEALVEQPTQKKFPTLIETLTQPNIKKVGGYPIDWASITRWVYLRQNKDSVKAIFNKFGNKFTMQVEADSIIADKSLYATAAYSEKNELGFYLVQIPKRDSIYCLGYAKVSDNKMPAPKKEPNEGQKNDPDSISWTVAKRRIDRWANDNDRNEWIDGTFEKYTKEKAIFIAFHINASDIKNHPSKYQDFYLALKKSNSMVIGKDTIKTKLMAEVIINNTSLKEKISQKIINLKGEEDATFPVPPFEPPF